MEKERSRIEQVISPDQYVTAIETGLPLDLSGVREANVTYEQNMELVRALQQALVEADVRSAEAAVDELAPLHASLALRFKSDPTAAVLDAIWLAVGWRRIASSSNDAGHSDELRERAAEVELAAGGLLTALGLDSPKSLAALLRSESSSQTKDTRSSTVLCSASL